MFDGSIVCSHHLTGLEEVAMKYAATLIQYARTEMTFCVAQRTSTTAEQQALTP